MNEQEYIEQRRAQANELSEKFREKWKNKSIQKGKIVFSTFEGDGGFCCNPRYIAELLHKQKPHYELVWLVKDLSKKFPDYIRVVEYCEDNIVEHLSTAQVWVDNYRKPWGTLKRQGQLYIQTWHASIGFKAVGLFRGELFPKIARIISEADSQLADFLLSNSDYCDSVYPKKLLYNGPTLRTGSPRVDCLINDREELRIKIRDNLNLNQETKLVLYAPTFRGGNQKGKKDVLVNIPSINFDELVNGLHGEFGGEWCVLLRLHPQLSAKLKEMPLNKKSSNLLDVSQESDISEIMGGCDMVITDYSSCAFDAAFAEIPVLLFADDVEEYIKNRGKFMWNKNELPFAIAQNNKELLYNIKSFQLKEYLKSVQRFKEDHGVVEDGHASERVVRKIIDFINETE